MRDKQTKEEENELRTTFYTLVISLSVLSLAPCPDFVWGHPGLLVAGSCCCIVWGLNAAFPCGSCLSYFIQETQSLLYFYFSLQNDLSDNRFKFWLLLEN
jgi:hypothetical protein